MPGGVVSMYPTVRQATAAGRVILVEDASRLPDNPVKEETSAL